MQRVDNALICVLAEPLGVGFGFADIADVRTVGHKLGGNGAADQPPLGMHDHPVAFVLIAEFLAREDGPNLFGGEFFAFFEESVGNFRAAVFRTGIRVVGGVLDHLLAREGEDLRARGQS